VVLAFGALLLLLLTALLAALALGSVRLSPSDVFDALFRPDRADRGALNVVRTVRLPRTAAAGLAGSALAICGAQMQTIFRNPLADPFVLGITGGASFGVAIVVLVVGTGSSQWVGGLDLLGRLGISGAAFAGAMAVTLVAVAVARRVRGTASILIVGLMIGYLLAALVSLIVATADPVRLRQFVTWGFGSFRGVTNAELEVMAPIVVAGIVLSLLATKSLNAFTLGERYAESMGVAVRRDRTLILLVASLLAGVVTAFTGPIAFVGVAAPHLARPLVRTSDHRILLPASAMIGAVVALTAEIVAQLPGRNGILPLNAVTAILGVPVVIWVLTRRARSEVVT
jgi:iron complex transport system permease protein